MSSAEIKHIYSIRKRDYTGDVLSRTQGVDMKTLKTAFDFLITFQSASPVWDSQIDLG